MSERSRAIGQNHLKADPLEITKSAWKDEDGEVKQFRMIIRAFGRLALDRNWRIMICRKAQLVSLNIRRSVFYIKSMDEKL